MANYTRSLRRIGSLLLLLVFAAIFLRDTPRTRAEVGIDIRASGALQADDARVEYLAVVDDCSLLLSVVVTGKDLPFSREDARPLEGSDAGCAIPFVLEGDARLQPSARFRFVDGTERVHAEVFSAET